MASSQAPLPPSTWWVAQADRSSASAVSSARLGRPVEPDVPIATARPSGSSAGSWDGTGGGGVVSGIRQHGGAAGQGRLEGGQHVEDGGPGGDRQRAGGRRGHQARLALGGAVGAARRRCRAAMSDGPDERDRADREADVGVEREHDAEGAADDPQHLEHRLGPREDRRADVLGDLALHEGVEAQLGQLRRHALDEAEQRRASTRRTRCPSRCSRPWPRAPTPWRCARAAGRARRCRRRCPCRCRRRWRPR